MEIVISEMMVKDVGIIGFIGLLEKMMEKMMGERSMMKRMMME
ncbi:hypothetical protein [Shigella flexneri]|nr:hypothetical protein [Shigella flexneri]